MDQLEKGEIDSEEFFKKNNEIYKINLDLLFWKEEITKKYKDKIKDGLLSAEAVKELVFQVDNKEICRFNCKIAIRIFGTCY